MPAGTTRVWRPAPGWPTPPTGWTPPPSWQPSPDWPPAPAGWQFWRDVVDRRVFLRAWWVVVSLVAIWVLANVGMAIGLLHHDDAVRHFDTVEAESDTVTAGISNPVGLVMSVAFALILELAVTAAAWIAAFWFGAGGRWATAGVTALFVLGVAIDGYQFWEGPFADTGYWQQSDFADVDQMRLAAAIAGGAVIVGAVLLLVAVRRRRAVLHRIAAADDA